MYTGILSCNSVSKFAHETSDNPVISGHCNSRALFNVGSQARVTLLAALSCSSTSLLHSPLSSFPSCATFLLCPVLDSRGYTVAALRNIFQRSRAKWNPSRWGLHCFLYTLVVHFSLIQLRRVDGGNIRFSSAIGPCCLRERICFFPLYTDFCNY